MDSKSEEKRKKSETDAIPEIKTSADVEKYFRECRRLGAELKARMLSCIEEIEDHLGQDGNEENDTIPRLSEYFADVSF